MKALLIFCLLLLPGSREGRAFERLNKLYPSETAACQELALKYISKHKNWSTPHYFMGLIHLESYSSMEQGPKKRRFLQKALSEYTLVQRNKSFEKVIKLSNEHLKPKLTEAIIQEIKTESSEEQRELWLRKAKRAGLEIDPKKIRLPEKNEPQKEQIVQKTHWYQGLPIGNELLVSANPEGERAILNYINAERKKLGMQPLIWDEDLAKAARYHSADMATENYFSHSSSDRTDAGIVEVGGAFERIKKFHTKGFAHSENIAAGNKDPYATYMQWFKSPGHYNNMFKANSTRAAIGVYYDPNSTYGWYWTFCGALN